GVRVRSGRVAAHAAGPWDLGHPGSALFEDFSLQWTAEPGPTTVSWIEVTAGPEQSSAGPVAIYQDSSGGENWQSPNHVNRAGEGRCRFKGYRVHAAGVGRAGVRASPIVGARWGGRARARGVREIWPDVPQAGRAGRG